jgi:hypothetical protein
LKAQVFVFEIQYIASCAMRLKLLLLVPKPVLIPAIRALPGNGIAGHAPDIFRHTFLADGETAAAAPAETKFFTAAVAPIIALAASFAPGGGDRVGFFHGCCFITLLV